MCRKLATIKLPNFRALRDLQSFIHTLPWVWYRAFSWSYGNMVSVRNIASSQPLIRWTRILDLQWAQWFALLVINWLLPENAWTQGTSLHPARWKQHIRTLWMSKVNILHSRRGWCEKSTGSCNHSVLWHGKSDLNKLCNLKRHLPIRTPTRKAWVLKLKESSVWLEPSLYDFAGGMTSFSQNYTCCCRVQQRPCAFGNCKLCLGFGANPSLELTADFIIFLHRHATQQRNTSMIKSSDLIKSSLLNRFKAPGMNVCFKFGRISMHLTWGMAWLKGYTAESSQRLWSQSMFPHVQILCSNEMAKRILHSSPRSNIASRNKIWWGGCQYNTKPEGADSR